MSEQESDFECDFVCEDGETLGHIRVFGRHAAVTLLTRSFFKFHSQNGFDLYGKSSNTQFISLHNCFWTRISDVGEQPNLFHKVAIACNFVFVGSRFIKPEDALFSSILFSFDEVGTLARGSKSFETLYPTQDEVTELLRNEHARRGDLRCWDDRSSGGSRVEIGPNPEMAYFSGKHEIAGCNVGGDHYGLQYRVGSNRRRLSRAQLEWKVAGCIRWSEPKSLKDSISEMQVLRQLIELVVGQRTRIREIIVFIDSVEIAEFPETGDLYWPYCNDEMRDAAAAPSIVQALLDTEARPDEFTGVMKAWLECNNSMGEARRRLVSSFFNRHSIDRLVSAANVFDLLPDHALQVQKTVREDLQSAVSAARNLFTKLPRSDERDGVLGALGRVAKPSLRDKVCHRASIIIAKSGPKFPDLHEVCKLAVSCRNHFVHGSELPKGLDRDESNFFFLTNTLEFVFAASDLISLGWDLEGWLESAYLYGHPFGRYVYSYKEYARRLVPTRV